MAQIQLMPGPMNWVFVGDSITHGILHTHGSRSWVELVHERIRWQLGRHEDAVINSGVTGWTATHMLSQWKRFVARHAPHVVSISFGANDALLGDVGIPTFTEAIQEITSRAATAGAQVILHTPTPALPDAGVRHRHLPAYAERIRELATVSGVLLADHERHWISRYGVKDPIAWLDDDTHPNAAGHVAMANHTLTVMGLGPLDDDS